MSVDEGLPVGWALAPLSDLLTAIETGKSFKCDERPPKIGEIGVVKVSAVSWGEYQERESKTCLDETRFNKALFIHSGDFLFSRANTIELVGACVIARQVTLRVMLSDKILRFKFISEGMKPWVLNLLRSRQGRSQIEALASGNQDSMRNIGQERIGQILVPLPPVNEQARIVEKLEELLSDLDAGVAELKAAQRKLAQYRQSLLKAAVEGALTTDWRAARAQTGEPQGTGTELLQRILTERRARWEASQLARFAEQGKTPPKGWQAKYKEPVAPNTDDLPALPDDWVWASVEQLAELVSGHTPKDADQFVEPGGEVCWFKVGDMNQEGNEEWMAISAKRFTKATATQLGLKVAPEGTIVFPKRGGAIATNKKRRLATAGAYDLNMMGLVAGPLVQDWLWSWFMGIDLGKLSDGSNVPQINNPDIAPLWVPVPPEEEQHRIRESLISLLDSVRDQEAATEHLLKQSAAQRKNILKAAFAGQLVPQDPNDEPASVLLERIRAAKSDRVGKSKPIAKRGRSA